MKATKNRVGLTSAIRKLLIWNNQKNEHENWLENFLSLAIQLVRLFIIYMRKLDRLFIIYMRKLDRLVLMGNVQINFGVIWHFVLPIT